jgi:hypothetical protein
MSWTGITVVANNTGITTTSSNQIYITGQGTAGNYISVSQPDYYQYMLKLPTDHHPFMVYLNGRALTLGYIGVDPDVVLAPLFPNFQQPGL